MGKKGPADRDTHKKRGRRPPPHHKKKQGKKNSQLEALELVAVLGGELVHDGGDHAAGAAPRAVLCVFCGGRGVVGRGGGGGAGSEREKARQKTRPRRGAEKKRNAAESAAPNTGRGGTESKQNSRPEVDQHRHGRLEHELLERRVVDGRRGRGGVCRFFCFFCFIVLGVAWV